MMNSSGSWIVALIAGAIAFASPAAHAQRGGGGHGGGHGGGMGAGMGGGFGSGMSSGVQRGSPGAIPMERSPEQVRGISNSDKSMAGDRPGNAGPKTAGELLQQNSKLSEGLAKLLPAGTDLQSASSGFKNLGEFVSAVHVSNNLGIPFTELKTRMMSGDSLGEAIKSLRPNVDSQIEERKARAKAEDEMTKG